VKNTVEIPVEATSLSVEASGEAANQHVDRKPVSVSDRKLAANRQNVLKSTSPKTPKGKANGRMNALKDGLFAMDIFSWGDLPGRESRTGSLFLIARWLRTPRTL
jgi:hypothetical protein